MALDVRERVISCVAYEKQDRDILIARAKDAPEDHRKDLLFESENGGYTSHYLDAGIDGRGWQVCYHWTIEPNVAGYFITWRETRAPWGSRAKFTGRSSHYFASRKMDVCKRKADQRAKKFIEMTSKKGAN